MKKITCIALALVMILAAVVQSFAFTDVSGEDLTTAVDTLQAMGLAEGMGGGIYSPDTVLTRAQFCTFLIKALGLEQKISTVSEKLLFTDVKPGNWYTGYVNLAYTEHLVEGRGNGKFGPNDTLKYDETVTMLLKLLGFTSNEIGKSWPDDYVNYAHYLELDENVSLATKAVVNRGQAAMLLYNALKTVPNRGMSEYYKTMKDVVSIEEAVIIDSDCSNNGRANQLKAFVPAYGSIKYYDKKHTVSGSFETGIADLMLDRSGDLLGLVLTDRKDLSVVIDSADLSGIKGKNGENISVPSMAKLISGSDIYSWGSRGYSAADDASGKTASIYKDDDGNITYIIISAAGTDSGEDVAVAKTASAATELRHALNAPSDCAVTKNNEAAAASDLAVNDVAYYDSVSRTLRACDWTVSGYIEKAMPGITSAETVVVSGCTLPVLECAREDLAKLSVGSEVTLLLTDDRKVAAAYAYGTVTDRGVGILGIGGGSITLAGSGLVITSGEIKGDAKLQGRLVTMSYSQTSIYCREYELKRPDKGQSLTLAPSCAIYEQANGSWLYSSDNPGYSASDIAGFHTNAAGQADILVLGDITGDLYTYGCCEFFKGTDGINLGSMVMSAYNDAATVTNASGTSRKHLCVQFKLQEDEYCGLALRSDASGYSYICAKAELTKQTGLSSASFFLMDDDYYAKLGNSIIPVSDGVQIYYKKNDRWESGTDALTAAINSGLALTVFYDRTPDTGAQVRIIELNN